MKVNLRMNLSHFLNKPYEEQVIQKLGEIHRDSIKYYLNLWYKDGTVTPEDIKKFLLEYESNLHFKTKIKVDGKLHPNDFIWYDIVSRENVNHKQRVRFQYIYNNKNQILDAIDEFHKAAKFCTSEKPPRVQKRNDYESSNNRK